MKTLQNIWDELPMKSDKGNVHSYLPVYEEILAPYRETAKNILEIGLFNGASLLMWEQYFTGKVYGVDCDVKPHGGMADLTGLIDKHNILIFNAEDPAEVEKHFKGIKFDVIIEDAGHHVEQQMNLFNILKDYLADGGLYIIEDLQDVRDKDYFPSFELIDRRYIKHRYDDMILIYRK
jgi:predicted O-methyltransferase YrrM